MRNDFLLILSFIVVVMVYMASSSSASVMLSVATLLLGWFMIVLFVKSGKERIEMTTAMLMSFVVFTIAAILQYFDYVADYGNFAKEGNDNYFFYITSMEGEGASSIGKLFNKTVIQNIHYENGGYFFYIKTLAYLAWLHADGNNILLQQLGTVLPSILSSVVLYAILSKYCPANKTFGYTCSFMVLSPLILHSVGIHRDAMVALLYFILIYLWLCKDFSLKVGVLQVLFAYVLYFFREQHGLFALSFVVVSSISTRKQPRLVYVIAVMVLIAIIGVTKLSNMLSTSLMETNEFYEDLRSDHLSGLSIGIGRYIYMLPSPIKEIAQISFLQLRFPPWLTLSEANNFPAVILGLLSFAVAFYWFFVFSVTLVSLVMKGYRCLPTKLILGLLLLFAFLFLNSANLDSRRVVCMYPLMFIPFVYYKEYILQEYTIAAFKRNYVLIYMSICFLYLAVKVSVG